MNLASSSHLLLLFVDVHVLCPCDPLHARGGRPDQRHVPLDLSDVLLLLNLLGLLLAVVDELRLTLQLDRLHALHCLDWKERKRVKNEERKKYIPHIKKQAICIDLNKEQNLSRLTTYFGPRVNLLSQIISK
jgi:hypothetical protein